MNSVQKYIGGNKPSDSLANYLRAAGYDVDNWDDADVRRNGMAMLSNARGTTLTDDDYGKATTELQRYLSIGAGQDAYRQSVADAENEAKRTVAYNEYLDQRVASYLGEIEGAAGQKGYSGVTEGNRIALRNSLANRQQSVATAKENAKQSALSNYLKVEDQANADYFSNMDATESATQSRRDTQVNNVKGEIGEAMSAASSSLEGLDDDTIARWRNYIRNYDFEDEGDRKKVLTWYNALYGGGTQAETISQGDTAAGTQQTQTPDSSAAESEHADVGGTAETNSVPQNKDKTIPMAADTPTTEKMKLRSGKFYVTNPYPSTISIVRQVDTAGSDLNLYNELNRDNPSVGVGTLIEHNGKLYMKLHCKDTVTKGFEPNWWFEVSKR